MKKIFTIALLAMMAVVLHAQEMSVSAPSSSVTGQYIHVRFEVNDKASGFTAPNWGGLQVVSGPSTGSSSSMSIINGKVSSSTSYTFEYLLVADKEGTYTVGPASCKAGGKRIQSKSFSIKVAKGSPNQQTQGYSSRSAQRQGYGYSSPAQSRTDGQAEPSATLSNKDVFATISVNKANPYQGEQVIITYKVYTRVPLYNISIDKLPRIKGFWSEDLSEGKDLKQYEETVNGQRYHVAELRRGAIFAQESGRLKVDPLNLDVLAQVQVQRQRQRRSTGDPFADFIDNFFNDAFFNQSTAVKKHLTSNAPVLNVKPLPSAPEGYIGAVGRFNVTDKVDLPEVRAGEAVTYSVTINGSGNLMLVDAPSITFPETVEAYDPETEDHFSKTDGGVSGSRTFKFVLIPRNEGTLTIPQTKIAYFDPLTGSYVTKVVGGQTVTVKPGDPRVLQNLANKTDVKKLNSDINYIHTGNARLSQSKPTLSWLPIALLFECAVGYLLMLWFKRRHRQMADIAGVRLRRATKEARRRLRKAEKHLRDGNDELFYEEIYKAIWGCLADKFNIELSQLSRDTVQQCLLDKQVSDDQQQLILSTLNDVDFARFAPGDKSQLKQGIYDKAFQMINKVISGIL